MSSLKSAANSYGVASSKGYLPHRYVQNCSSATEILERINRTMPWRDLELYMDWFTDVTDAKLHERKAGRTWEQWRDEQPLRKEFDPEKICNFRQDLCALFVPFHQKKSYLSWILNLLLIVPLSI